MATRAVYTFSGFTGEQDHHLYLHHDGYPTGAAWRLSQALQLGDEPSAFLRSFRSTQAAAEPLAHPEHCGDAEYRYHVQLINSADPSIQVQCWRRLPEGKNWHMRCNPMPLAAFIQRFLPSESPA
ncbi:MULTISPECIES: hypothetical protein [unclassified Synechococcus]|uniref:hypothetical protein n=1 Tax=unclassified Synechococcus TaxID=2626047 RepID=UPI0021A3B8E6|nr:MULTISPECIES: hypothetical protein [unclassified Synechococcus]MCT0213256.1 hypothetical protein [Synechococcus sp. CS-1326]MCT0231931.1 hypothetical protein [Synechococcus sp. CS-1327]